MRTATRARPRVRTPDGAGPGIEAPAGGRGSSEGCPCAAMTHMTERVELRALEQNAAAVVARAAAGEIIEITDRGRPVAQITPLAPGRLASLVGAGQARPARRRAIDLPPPPAARPGSPSLGDLLEAARAMER